MRCARCCPKTALRRHPDRRPARAGVTREQQARRARSSACSWAAARPACFRPRAIGRVIEALRAALPMAPDAEITLEANPATVERGRFAEYRAAGINRVSLGAQSFDPRSTQGAGPHPQGGGRASRRRRAARLRPQQLQPGPDVRAAGTEPGRRTVRPDIGAGAAAGASLALPAHAGAGHACSRTARRRCPTTTWPLPCRPSVTRCWRAHGYAQYETSAFARAGRQCVHNLNYWNFGDYLGVGAGAHGKLTAGDEPQRSSSAARTCASRGAIWQARPAVPSGAAVPQADLPFEFMMNALRLTAGFARQQFSRAHRTCPLKLSQPRSPTWQARASSRPPTAVWRPSPRGPAVPQ